MQTGPRRLQLRGIHYTAHSVKPCLIRAHWRCSRKNPLVEPKPCESDLCSARILLINASQSASIRVYPWLKFRLKTKITKRTHLSSTRLPPLATRLKPSRTFSNQEPRGGYARSPSSESCRADLSANALRRRKRREGGFVVRVPPFSCSFLTPIDRINCAIRTTHCFRSIKFS